MSQTKGNFSKEIILLDSRPQDAEFPSDTEKVSVTLQDEAKIERRSAKRKISEDDEESVTPAKKRREFGFPSQKDQSAKSMLDGNRKRKASDLEEPASKRIKGDTAEEEDPKTQFEAKYEQQNPLGVGGCGSVFAGYRKSDHLAVAIKHIPNDFVYCKHKDDNGRELSVEVAVMLKLQSGTSNSEGSKAPIALLDWYELPDELILVLERPVPAVDLLDYIVSHKDSFSEEEAKTIMKQLVKAAIHLQDEEIFHRDIKLENVLIETSSDTPKVRIIDFGLSCVTKTKSTLHTFYGTEEQAPPEWQDHHGYSAGPSTVWQLGIIQYEILHRKRFNTHRFLRKQIKIEKNLSDDCKKFMRKCFIRNPSKRPTLQKLLLHPWLN